MAQSQSRPTTLNFITGNANKLAEVRAILDGVVDLQSRDVKDLDEIQGTIEEIARDKCSRAAERVSLFFRCLPSTIGGCMPFWMVLVGGGEARLGDPRGQLELERRGDQGRWQMGLVAIGVSG